MSHLLDPHSSVLEWEFREVFRARGTILSTFRDIALVEPPQIRPRPS